MKKLLLIFFILFLNINCTNDLEKYKSLKNPRIFNLPSQKMITAELKGISENSRIVISTLYRIYFLLGLKSKKMISPRARFIKIQKSNDYKIIYGLPIAENIDKLPPIKEKLPVEVKIEIWEYGDVAEILHIGPYNKKDKALNVLKKFIKEKGYKIIGPQEEEYIKGPNLFYENDPEKYYTIIRYEIKK